MGSEIGIEISSTYKSDIYSPSQNTRANGIEGSGKACGANVVVTAKNFVKQLVGQCARGWHQGRLLALVGGERGVVFALPPT
jgi:hypothetical protein